MDAFCQYLYFNDMSHRVLCLFLPSFDVQPIARGENGNEKEREKKRGKEQEKSDGWLTRLYLPGCIFLFSEVTYRAREPRRIGGMHARTISERKHRYFTEKCDNEPATGLPTRVISEMMLQAEFPIHLCRQPKKCCIIRCRIAFR